MNKQENGVQKEKNRSHFEYTETFIRYGIYPSSVSSKDFGSKSNFRRTAKNINLKDEHLDHGEKLVIKERDWQAEIKAVSMNVLEIQNTREL